MYCTYVTVHIHDENVGYICVFCCFSLMHHIINVGLAGKNFAEIGCSFIGCMSGI